MPETEEAPPFDLLAALPIGKFLPVADGVHRLAVLFVNVYAVDGPDGFVLVDTGPPAAAWYVQKAVADHYGPDAKPSAIVLTHAHFDHAGNAKALAAAYGAPVYVHELELPYVTGRSDYAPGDPTPGGAICFLSRFFPRGGIDLGDAAHLLPADNSVPDLAGWRWLHTPGHSAGHVSLVRDDGVAIVGDAVATHDMDAWNSQATWPRELARPATPFTPDWPAARRSIETLADANVTTVAAGHGLPIHDPEMAAALRTFAKAMQEPDGGRYSGTPATYDDSGALAGYPPPAPDPIGRTLAISAAGLAAGAIGAAAVLTARRNRLRA